MPVFLLTDTRDGVYCNSEQTHRPSACDMPQWLQFQKSAPQKLLRVTLQKRRFENFEKESVENKSSCDFGRHQFTKLPKLVLTSSIPNAQKTQRKYFEMATHTDNDDNRLVNERGKKLFCKYWSKTVEKNTRYDATVHSRLNVCKYDQQQKIRTAHTRCILYTLT